ncbi:glycine cleavage system aminomethyltransferase GcvT [Nocardioides humilatus]|uniref:Aminomethyltransferase n=1 Tax=Nocardioides humilatus TaxID=2607660 RepID=A0A5B1L8D9_9ACTN|nr:glycine cleavage system aminomethyltransferase GcvT [Nocardioides humilatus]KAA1416991.1 glycine cleavage system aminomethyltransferase GcvT [Nocardioides humilatus]
MHATPSAAPSTTLLRSPLHDRHEALGAKFAEFGGWEMPLQYSGIVEEHNAVRSAVGIFDVSHLGKIVVRGPGAADFVNATLSNDLGRIGPGRAQYTLCLDAETGGIIDDIFSYYRDHDHVLLVPNAANNTEVFNRLVAAAPDGVEVVNHHADFAVLAVQGTKSDDVLAAAGFATGHDYLTFVEADFEGQPVIVCRTGYTGERGYELIAPSSVALQVWDAVVAAGAEHGILPCGLGARDTLRTEMGYPLHGQDIGPTVTPNEARLGWAVGWKKPEFWGRDAVVAEKERGAKRKLVGIKSTGRAIPRPHMSISLVPDVLLGEVTSGTFSPSLKRGIGMALVSTVVDDDAEVAVDVRGRREVFTIVKPPFVDTSVRES